MTTAVAPLPLTAVATPASQAELVETIGQAAAGRTPIYPLGGQTSLDYGLPARTPGLGIDLTALNRVVDYPARDLTVTVEAGLTLAALASILAQERQWLPLDPPDPERATVGGLVATAWSGPRRFGYGTLRDYVLGISAVDGRGTLFKGGGRVVKNVAGYDFCKLLTGSLGTLGVVSQVTLKIKPRPEASSLVACDLADLDQAESALAALVQSATAPAAVELLLGPAWSNDEALGPVPAATAARLVVGLEGTTAEVEWMQRQLADEWRAQAISSTQVIAGSAADGLWQRLRDFAALRHRPLVVKIATPPSRATELVALARRIDPQVSVQSHAGSGVTIVQFAEFEPGQVSRALVGELHPAALAAGGRLVVVASSGLGELTHQATWGPADPAFCWMGKVKQQFDPQGLLNPGRFVYEQP